MWPTIMLRSLISFDVVIRDVEVLTDHRDILNAPGRATESGTLAPAA